MNGFAYLEFLLIILFHKRKYWHSEIKGQGWKAHFSSWNKLSQVVIKKCNYLWAYN